MTLPGGGGSMFGELGGIFVNVIPSLAGSQEVLQAAARDGAAAYARTFESALAPELSAVMSRVALPTAQAFSSPLASALGSAAQVIAQRFGGDFSRHLGRIGEQGASDFVRGYEAQLSQLPKVFDQHLIQSADRATAASTRLGQALSTSIRDTVPALASAGTAWKDYHSAAEAATSGMAGKVKELLQTSTDATAEAVAGMSRIWKIGLAGTAAYAGIEVVRAVKQELSGLAHVGAEAADGLMGAFEAVVAGKMPDLMGAFNVLEDGAKAALRGPLDLLGAVNPALHEAVKLFDSATFGVFDKFKDTLGPVVETIVDVGDKYIELSRKLASSTLDTTQLEGLSASVRDIMASGAVVHFDDVADSIGRLNSNIAGLDLTHLKELTTTFAEAEELVGHIDETKFAGIVNAWNIPGAQANETLLMLTNTVRATGVDINTLTDEMIRSGPAMRSLGFDAETTATIFARMTQQGERGIRLAQGMNEVVKRLNDQVADGAFKTLPDAWDSLSTAIQQYVKVGNDADALKLLDQYTSPANATLLLEMFKNGTIGAHDFKAAIEGTHEPLDKAVEETKSLGDTFMVVGQQISAALSPIGMALAGALREAGSHVSEWISENQAKILGWGADIVIMFGQVMTAAAGTFMQILSLTGPFLDAFKGMFRLAMDGILDVMTPLAKGLGGILGGPFAKFGESLDKIHSGIDKLGSFSFSDMFGKGSEAVDHFADSTFPKLASRLHGFVTDFQAAEAVNEAFVETINGKTVPAFNAVADAAGSFGTPDKPHMQLLGDAAQRQEVLDRLRQQGIGLSADDQGNVDDVTFPGVPGKVTSDDARKNWTSWWDEHVGGKPNPVKLQPQNPDGQNVDDTGGLLPPGQVDVHLVPQMQAPVPQYQAPTSVATPVPVQTRAAGGGIDPIVPGDYIPGAGDTVPALLTPGEYVIRRDQAFKHRNLLDAINFGGDVSRFAGGGDVVPKSKPLQMLMGFLRGALGAVGVQLPKHRDSSEDSSLSVPMLSAYSAGLGASPTSASSAQGPLSGGVPLVQNPDGTWTSSDPAWAHLIKRESSGINQRQKIIDVNSGGNEAEGLFQITPATWRSHGGTEFAPNPLAATPQQQAIIAARILKANPSGSDWGAGLPGRETAAALLSGLRMAGGGSVPGYAHGGVAKPPSSWFGSVKHEAPGPSTENISKHFSHLQTGGCVQHGPGCSGFHIGGPVPGFAKGGPVTEVIWENTETGQDIGEANGQWVGTPGSADPGYYHRGKNDFLDHRGHVHTTFTQDPFTGQPYNQVKAGSDIRQGAPGFPPWVYELGRRFNVRPSTYPGHQEWAGVNHGIDWWPIDKANMQGAGYSHQDRVTLTSFATAVGSLGAGQSQGAPGGATGEGSPYAPAAAATNDGGMQLAGSTSPDGGSFPGGQGGPIGPGGIIGPGPNPWNRSTWTQPISPKALNDWVPRYERWQFDEHKRQEAAGDAQQRLTAAIDKQRELQERYNTETEAWNRQTDEQKKANIEGWKELQKTTQDLSNANHELTTANDQVTNDQLDAQAGHPAPKPEGGREREGGPFESMSQQLGGGLVKGLFQELGFPDIFGKPVTQWGIWRLFTGSLGFGLGLLNNYADQAIGGQGGPLAGLVPNGAGFPGSLPGQSGGPLGPPPGPATSADSTQTASAPTPTGGPASPVAPGGPPAKPRKKLHRGADGEWLDQSGNVVQSWQLSAPESQVDSAGRRGLAGNFDVDPTPAPKPPAPPAAPHTDGPQIFNVPQPPQKFHTSAPARATWDSANNTWRNAQGQPIPRDQALSQYGFNNDGGPPPGVGGGGQGWQNYAADDQYLNQQLGSMGGILSGDPGKVADNLIDQLPRQLVGLQTRMSNPGVSRGTPPSPNLLAGQMQAGNPNASKPAGGGDTRQIVFNNNNLGVTSEKQMADVVSKQVSSQSRWWASAAPVVAMA